MILFFPDQNRTIDIRVRDTYYVIAQRNVFVFLAFVFWIMWFLYLITRKVLYSRSLIWAHVSITLVTMLILLFLLSFSSNAFNQPPRHVLDYSVWKPFGNYEQGTRWIAYITIVLLLGQITFIVNLVVGLFKRVA